MSPHLSPVLKLFYNLFAALLENFFDSFFCLPDRLGDSLLRSLLSSSYLFLCHLLNVIQPEPFELLFCEELSNSVCLFNCFAFRLLSFKFPLHSIFRSFSRQGALADSLNGNSVVALHMVFLLCLVIVFVRPCLEFGKLCFCRTSFIPPYRFRMKNRTEAGGLRQRIKINMNLWLKQPPLLAFYPSSSFLGVKKIVLAPGENRQCIF